MNPMGIVTMVFYIVAGAWLVGLAVFGLIKRSKAKKRVKQEVKDIEDKEKGGF